MCHSNDNKNYSNEKITFFPVIHPYTCLAYVNEIFSFSVSFNFCCLLISNLKKIVTKVLMSQYLLNNVALIFFNATSLSGWSVLTVSALVDLLR
jgi:hypothetical protein